MRPWTAEHETLYWWVYAKGQTSALQKGCVPSDQPQLSKVEAVVVICYWCTGCTLGGGGCLKGETEQVCVLLQIQGLQLKKNLRFFMCLLELFTWKDEFPLKGKDKNSLVGFCYSCEEMTFSSNSTSLVYLLGRWIVTCPWVWGLLLGRAETLPNCSGHGSH